jgi:glucokinase
LLGHFGCDRCGHLCSCGNIGCVEAEASTFALPGLCREHVRYADSPLAHLRDITFKDLFCIAECGDACALEIRERSVQVWAAAAVSWIHAYDPEVIVFGGGVMSEAETILAALTTHVHRHAWTPWGKVAVRKAELGNEASLFAGPALFSERV